MIIMSAKSTKHIVKQTRNVRHENNLEIPLAPRTERTPLAPSIPTYYQYVSLILLLQAVLFYVPAILGHHLVAKLAGILPDEVALSALSARRTTTRLDKEAAIQDVAQHVSLYCTQQVRRRHVSYALWWLQGNKVVLLELVSKVIYVANDIGQFFMLDVFLGMPFHRYGLQIMGHNAFHSTEVFLSSVLGLKDMSGISNLQDINITIPILNWTHVEFPTSGLCDFSQRLMGTIQHHTIQCLMPVNTLNVIFFNSRRMVIREMLQDAGVLAPRGLQGSNGTNGEENGESDMDLVGLFEYSYLRRDGLFLLDTVDTAAGNVVAVEFLKLVWSMYKENVSDLQMLATRVRYEERWIDEPTQIPVSNTRRRSPAPDEAQETFISMNSQASGEPESPPPYDDLVAK